MCRTSKELHEEGFSERCLRELPCLRSWTGGGRVCVPAPVPGPVPAPAPAGAPLSAPAPLREALVAPAGDLLACAWRCAWRSVAHAVLNVGYLFRRRLGVAGKLRSTCRISWKDSRLCALPTTHAMPTTRAQHTRVYRMFKCICERARTYSCLKCMHVHPHRRVRARYRA